MGVDYEIPVHQDGLTSLLRFEYGRYTMSKTKMQIPAWAEM